MPKSIKPQMSKDELASFDAGIFRIEYDEGEALVTATNKYNDDVVSLWLSEKDCQDIIQFIRRNKL